MVSTPAPRFRMLDAYVLLVLLCALGYGWLASSKPLLPEETAYLEMSTQLRQGLRGEGAAWAFRVGYFGQWQPLAWLSHELDFSLYGDNLKAHRVTSVVLHVLNTVMLFLLLSKASPHPWRSFSVAVIFALHPLHLEAVTAPSARGLVLGTTFFFAALAVYGQATQNADPLRYLLILLLSAAAMLSCPAMIVVPLLFLLCDLWPLRRLKFRGVSAEPSSARGWVAVKGMSVRGLLLEKTPLLVIAASVALFSMVATREWYRAPFVLVPTPAHAVFDTFGWLFLYLARALWPFTLSAFYAAGGATLPFWEGAFALLLLLGVSVVICRAMWRYPYLFVCWFWFLLSLFPQLPLLPWGAWPGSDSAIYLPLTGLIVLFVWALGDLTSRRG